MDKTIKIKLINAAKGNAKNKKKIKPIAAPPKSSIVCD
jgi:hypothetical protein